MAWRIFISRCKNILNDCTQQLLMDDVGPDVLQLALRRLETMQRSLQWARGRLINVTAADQLLRDLTELIQEVELSTQHGQQGCFGYQAPVVFNRGRGRPLYLITREQLSFLKSCGFTAPQMADILNVSLRTIRRRLRQYHFTRASMYAELTDSALDEHVQDIVAGNEQIGPEAVRASLRVPSMLRMNPGAAALRAVLRRPERRTYQVAGPNSLWHIDGNHKLIRWRIVIHGAIDGYSRLVVFLHASNNNRSSTVLSSFIRAVVSYGVPSRVRTDRGGENNAVCLMMNIFRGFDRGSALRGRSDLWQGMTNVYCDLFHHLDEEGIIDIDNEMHLWALHYIYLPRINRDLKDFTQQWNNHGLRTERHLSPLQIFVQGSLEQQGRASTAMQDIFQTRAAAADGTIGGTADGSVTATENEITAAQVLGTDSGGGGAHGTDELGLLVDWPERITQVVELFNPLSGTRGSHGIELNTGLIYFLDYTYH
ncbi:adhesion G-protein coupled receptor G5 [Sarotherodon galilaeus]